MNATSPFIAGKNQMQSVSKHNRIHFCSSDSNVVTVEVIMLTGHFVNHWAIQKLLALTCDSQE